MTGRYGKMAADGGPGSGPHKGSNYVRNLVHHLAKGDKKKFDAEIEKLKNDKNLTLKDLQNIVRAYTDNSQAPRSRKAALRVLESQQFAGR